ncbi:MAG: hypothetical protein GY940_46815 [bacterium]|nr:hypothetical protein [bacterium]
MRQLTLMKSFSGRFTDKGAAFQKSPLVLLIFLFVVSSLFAEEVRLRVPVHMQALGELKKEDITLRVNGVERDIERLEVRTRNIRKTSDLSRYFILSFHMDSYEPGIMEAVEYFINDIADRTDSVTLLTPLKAYRLAMSGGKDRVLDSIQELLKKDCYDYKVARTGVFGTVQRSIEAVKRLRFATVVFNPYYDLVLTFYNQCRQVISELKTQFLSPFLRQSPVIAKLPDRGDGETWWIHFQQRSFEPVPAALRDAVRAMVFNQRTRRVWSTRSFDFQEIIKQMSIGPDFPVSVLSTAVLGENICYNVINWGTIDTGKTTNPDFIRPEIENLLEKLTSASGGKMVSTVNSLEGLKQLEQHQDRYYEVVFPFNNKIETKTITIIHKNSKQGKSLRYPGQWNPGRIKTMINAHSSGKVAVDGFEMKGNRIGFLVSGFHRFGDDRVGLLKVRARLFKNDAPRVPVFNNSKILRAARDNVRISLPLPKKYNGSFQLKITVCDLMTNKLVEIEEPVHLN